MKLRTPQEAQNIYQAHRPTGIADIADFKILHKALKTGNAKTLKKTDLYRIHKGAYCLMVSIFRFEMGYPKPQSYGKIRIA